jgi:hypothetical protein
VRRTSIVLPKKRVQDPWRTGDTSGRRTLGHEHQGAGTEKALNVSMLGKKPSVCDGAKNFITQFL